MATIIDGKAAAEKLRTQVKAQAAAFLGKHGRAPGLEVILVGEDPASQVYTRNKEKAAKEAGIRGVLHTLPSSTTTQELLAQIDKLNRDDSVDGILVQLPLPKHIDETLVLDAVAPAKDVDGFHPMNAGKLASGRTSLVPCTPRGCMHMLADTGVSLEGAHAVVIGRSNIVGKPMAQLLLQKSCTVTIAHSKTRDRPALSRTADVLVAAVGRPELVRGDWIKEGAVVLDVGINRVDDPERPGKTRLVGDVHFAEASARAGFITPVPGGVGPMTIACLLENTVLAANLRMGVA
jgi:methylenetetrahydrofolate dehydrogenase (NADP+)/methenyltetrahydrofolate cyclohydrolase